MHLLSWNVNGIRAVERKGFVPWLTECNADVVCLQETKANREQLSDELTNPSVTGYRSWFASASRKGYSGVALYAKIDPLEIELFELPDFDDEGRMIIAHFDRLSILNGYFPNSQEGGARLGYKLDYCAALQERATGLVRAGRNVVICGDYNIAHRAIDLARPKENEGSPGYLPEERQWMSRFLDSGFIDTFRIFEPEGSHYSWWSYRAGARRRNVGWRIDYHCVNEGLRDKVVSAEIHPQVTGSDHCPVSVGLLDF